MKRTISLFAALIIVFAFSGTAFAQSDDVQVNAEVAAEITVTKNTNVDFGTVQATSNPDIVPGGTNTDTGENATTGKVTISAAASTQLVVSWNNDATLSDGESSESTMSFTADVNSDTTNTESNATGRDLTDGSADSNTKTNVDGDLYLWIGGDLGGLSSQTAGTYTTSSGSSAKPLTVTVNYQ